MIWERRDIALGILFIPHPVYRILFIPHPVYHRHRTFRAIQQLKRFFVLSLMAVFRADDLYAGFSWHSTDALAVGRAHKIALQLSRTPVGNRRSVVTLGATQENPWKMLDDGVFVERAKPGSFMAGYAFFSRFVAQLREGTGVSDKFRVVGHTGGFDPQRCGVTAASSHKEEEASSHTEAKEASSHSSGGGEAERDNEYCKSVGF